ncbi:hypothetical protein JTB14_016300 [Gonioctena quinquepunctata]|nr:hypothetical protein JTB14_016300 [Gonioctena quinquepunctata]
MEEMRMFWLGFLVYRGEEIPTNSDEDLPLASNDEDSDSTIIINMDKHMQRREVDNIETPASPVPKKTFRPGEYIQEWAPTSVPSPGFVRGDP